MALHVMVAVRGAPRRPHRRVHEVAERGRPRRAPPWTTMATAAWPRCAAGSAGPDRSARPRAASGRRSAALRAGDPGRPSSVRGSGRGRSSAPRASCLLAPAGARGRGRGLARWSRGRCRRGCAPCPIGRGRWSAAPGCRRSSCSFCTLRLATASLVWLACCASAASVPPNWMSCWVCWAFDWASSKSAWALICSACALGSGGGPVGFWLRYWSGSAKPMPRMQTWRIRLTLKRAGVILRHLIEGGVSQHPLKMAGGVRIGLGDDLVLVDRLQESLLVPIDVARLLGVGLVRGLGLLRGADEGFRVFAETLDQKLQLVRLRRAQPLVGRH